MTMGRPALFLLRIHVAFSNDVLTRIARRTTVKGRSELIRKAVDRYLEDLENEDAGLPSQR